MKRAFVLSTVLLACGPKPQPTQVATLPGDGDTNVAKPIQPTKPTATDAWSGRTDLIVAPASKPPAKLDL
jgi:hypothetical protein